MVSLLFNLRVGGYLKKKLTRIDKRRTSIFFPLDEKRNVSLNFSSAGDRTRGLRGVGLLHFLLQKGKSFLRQFTLKNLHSYG